jgi:hypothetical protein
MAFMVRVMTSQPARPFMFGFLTNLRKIEFVRVNREAHSSDSVAFVRSGPLEMHSPIAKSFLGTFLMISTLIQ